ncbi:MAG: DUF3368 domain-containing protein [Muribaculum sp.]|nr:DUF3368 domain-containing protein [Muribaculum sp.]
MDILKHLYGKVLIPNAVYMELTANEKFVAEASQVMDSDFLEVEKVDNEVAVMILQEVSGLDAGESEAIVMANNRKAYLLVMDEHKGRGVAKKMGLPITGTIGLLMKAFDEGMLSTGDIEECIERLKETNVRISKGLFDIMREHIKR